MMAKIRFTNSSSIDDEIHVDTPATAVGAPAMMTHVRQGGPA
jgi:hypothetical protein